MCDAALAESLISKISRRILGCNGFLEGRRDCPYQHAAYVYARLLEYQDELSELQTLFASGIPYTNSRTESDTKANATNELEERAANLVAAWQGNEKAKTERLLPMLDLEIQKCKEFAAAVLEPVSPCARPVCSADGITEFGNRSSGVQSLVVGIKFHRGNADGIAAGESVQLVREPNNPYDPNAIRVKLQTGDTLGYLTKEVAAVFVKQLDSGGDVRAQISKIIKDKVYVAVNPRRF